jgi:hypothetical protein
MNIDPAFSFPRAQDGYPVSTGFGSNTMYAEAPQYPLESPEMRGAPSNYSTASGPSATSSAAQSPQSMHGHIVPQPEWHPHGLALNPSIVSYDNYSHGGSEYTFQQTGMDDFALEFSTAKPNGFVGECKNISRSRQHGSISSNAESVSSMSTFVPSPITPISRPQFSPVTPLSGNRDSTEDSFNSFSSAFLPSVSERRPSQAFTPSAFSSSGTIQDMRSPPTPSDSSPLFSSHRQSHFFSQSSGNFVPPLQTSCWFPVFQHLIYKFPRYEYRANNSY